MPEEMPTYTSSPMGMDNKQMRAELNYGFVIQEQIRKLAFLFSASPEVFVNDVEVLEILLEPYKDRRYDEDRQATEIRYDDPFIKKIIETKQGGDYDTDMKVRLSKAKEIWRELIRLADRLGLLIEKEMDITLSDEAGLRV